MKIDVASNCLRNVEKVEEKVRITAIEGVIFDVDGTLVLSNDAQAQAWVEGYCQLNLVQIRLALIFLNKYPFSFKNRHLELVQTLLALFGLD